MVAAMVAVGLRTLVAAVLVLTASWKMANRREFSVSFKRLAPRRIARFAPSAAWPIGATEMALGGALIAGIRVQSLALVGPIAAMALVAAFTLALALGEDGDCGCWFTPASAAERGAKLVFVLRNVTVLTCLGVAALLSPSEIHGLGFATALSPLVAGLLLAALLVEAPRIVAAVTFPPTTVGGTE